MPQPHDPQEIEMTDDQYLRIEAVKAALEAEQFVVQRSQAPSADTVVTAAEAYYKFLAKQPDAPSST